MQLIKKKKTKTVLAQHSPACPILTFVGHIRIGQDAGLYFKTWVRLVLDISQPGQTQPMNTP